MNLQRTKTVPAFSAASGNGNQSLRLSAAHDEWNHVGIALVALEEGFFAEEGLSDVQIAVLDEASSELLEREAAQIDWLAKGLVDVAVDPRTTFVLEAKNENQSVCIVAARRKNHAFLLLGQKGLGSIRDLAGKTVHMNHRGGATDVMMRQLLTDQGLLPDTDVKFHYTGGAMHDPAGTARAFLEGNYGPALLLIPPEAPPLLKAGCSILADLRELYPSRHDRVTAANEWFCQAHPERLKGFLKGMIRGCRFVLDVANKDRFLRILQNAGFLTSEREERSFAGLFEAWQDRVAPDLSLPMEGIELIVEEERKAAKIAPTFKASDVLRLDPLHEAQRELGSGSSAQ